MRCSVWGKKMPHEEGCRGIGRRLAALVISTKILVEPFLKLLRAYSRSFWLWPPCRATAGRPCATNASATSSHLVWKVFNSESETNRVRKMRMNVLQASVISRPKCKFWWLSLTKTERRGLNGGCQHSRRLNEREGKESKHEELQEQGPSRRSTSKKVT